MFLLKKIVAPLFLPLPLCLLLLGAGLALLWFTRRERAGRILATTSFVLLVALSYGVSTPLLTSLERYHEPFNSVASGAGIQWVVVLGGGTSSDPSLPLRARLSEATLARLVEGVRLHRQMPGPRLVLSGAGVFESGSDAESMSALAVSLGVARDKIVIDDESQDTETQARIIKAIVKGERCVLVTSASHMRRSVALFRKVGLDPIPAPTHYLSQANVGISSADFYPRLGGLRAAETVAYEYLGIAWALVREKI